VTDPTPLLVPMPVQAFLVNPPVQHGVFQRWNTNYDSLNQFQDPVPAPFSNLTDRPPPLGVHLHWKLPAALTRGQSTAPGTTKVTFPVTPNRWIVMRVATTAGSVAKPEMKAWVIQSDYLGDDATSVFADPRTSTSGKVVKTRIGKQWTLEEWRGEPGGELFLTATGVADVTFTAYQPGIDNVYAFYDDTTKLAENTLLTYLVAGWYSNPAKDPLADHTPAQLRWMVLGNPAQAPSLSVFHGLIYGVLWQTTLPPPRTDPDATHMQVGVGYTSVDALAAVLTADVTPDQTRRDLETRLEAFQYEMLREVDQPDGHAQLELKIRDAWFGKTPGGTRWDIQPVSQGQNTTAPIDRAAPPAPPPLTDGQARWLAALNVTQRQLDAAVRELITLQQELFFLWWKAQRGQFVSSSSQRQLGVRIGVILDRVSDALDPGRPGSAMAAVVALQGQVADRRKQVPDPTSEASIDAWSKLIPAGPVPVRLKPQALPSFFHPSDPVLLVAGITPPTNEVDPDAILPCRTPDAAVTGVQVGATPVTRGTGSLGSIIPVPASVKLPAAITAAVTALAVESFFVDANDAASIVKNGLGSTDPGTVAALRAAMDARTAQLSSIATPLRADFAYARWQQAWAPLYLQWNITWFPTVTAKPVDPREPPEDARYQDPDGRQDNWPFTPEPWAFDGGDDVTLRGSEYYHWTGGEVWGGGEGLVPPRSYIGRTFLTPQATFLLIRRLADYLKLHPGDAELQQLEALIQKVGETRFLSQTLSGFNSAFVMRGLSQSPPPPEKTAIADAVGGENRGVPMVELGDQDLSFDTGTSFFYPVRGGYFQFERLIVVDAFGQVLDLLQANQNSTGVASNFFPIRGAGLVPEGDSGIATPRRRVRQVPRVVQPNRFELRLLDAMDDSKEIYYAPGTNPVSGWLLPNHLDRAISVYAAGGEPLGELLVLADVTGARVVRWLAAPGVPNPITDPARIPNPHLAALFSAFTASSGGIQGDRVAAFEALYRSIDETLWMVDPPGHRGDQELAVLIGRPLALVRAQVQFELFGRPAVNQSWRDTLQDVRAELGTFSFPIRMGSTELLDDGLIGYFTALDYLRFNAVHPSGTATSPYVAPVGPGNYLSLKFNYPSYTTLNLSLLLDPFGSVHATTGILPTASLSLPAEFYARALERLVVTFRSGPVVTDPSTIRLPFPAEQNGSWAWIRHQAPGEGGFVTQPILPADAAPRLADQPPALLDGWLKFTPRAPTP